MTLEKRLTEYWQSNSLTESGSTVIVACSGGPDSLALLDILWSLKEKLDTSTARGKFTLLILQGVAQFERDLIKERQAEGIEIAKAQGKFAKPTTPKPDNWQELYEKYKQRELTATALAKKLGISRSLLYKWIREEKEK